MIKLNGGLGTSMGMNRPKSLINVKNDLSFLDITAKQVIQLRNQGANRFPLVLMNSFNTRKDTLDSLERYPELSSDIPSDFLQHKVPKVMQKTLNPVCYPENRQKEWCPPGHGDIYTALVTSGLLEQMQIKGYEYMFISNIDNLGAVFDPAILGYFADEKIPFLMEVTDRTDSDKKGGHLAQHSTGRLLLRELAQCPKDELDDFQDIKLYKFFNTNNIWINIPDLVNKLKADNNILDLTVIYNKKSVNPSDPESCPVFQLETAMGSAISVFEKAKALRVPRKRFIPVKTTDDLLRIRSDFFVIDKNWHIRTNPECKENSRPPFVCLDNKYFKLIHEFERRFPFGPPSMINCKSLKVKGDIYFSKGNTVNKDAVLINNSENPVVLPDNINLEGKIRVNDL